MENFVICYISGLSLVIFPYLTLFFLTLEWDQQHYANSNYFLNHAPSLISFLRGFAVL